MKKRIFTYILTALIAYQLYFPLFSDKHITVFIIGVLALFLVNTNKSYMDILKSRMIFYLLFFIFLGLSFLYTAGKMDGLKYIIFLGMPLIIYTVFQDIKIEKETILKIFVYSCVPVAVLTICMYIYEDYEMKVLGSKIMGLFIEPSALHDHITGKAYGNVIEPHRVGGIFLNAQNAGLLAGFNLIANLWLMMKNKSVVYLLFALIWVSNYFMFGSIVCTAALIAVFLAGGIIWLVKRHGFNIKLAIYGICLLLALGISAKLLIKYNARNYYYVVNVPDNGSLHGRTRIWKTSLLVIKDNWLKGVGLDSKTWDEKYSQYISLYKTGEGRIFPPHNMYLTIWAKSGIFAFLFFVLFIIVNLYYSAKAYFKSDNLYELAIFMSILWLALEGITESMPLMDVRITAALFMIIGLGENGRQLWQKTS
jgi:O-antigen ligase